MTLCAAASINMKFCLSNCMTEIWGHHFNLTWDVHNVWTAATLILWWSLIYFTESTESNYLGVFWGWESSGSIMDESLFKESLGATLLRERRRYYLSVSHSAVCEVHMKNGANIQCWCNFWRRQSVRDVRASLYSGWNSEGPQTTWMNLSHISLQTTHLSTLHMSEAFCMLLNKLKSITLVARSISCRHLWSDWKQKTVFNHVKCIHQQLCEAEQQSTSFHPWSSNTNAAL